MAQDDVREVRALIEGYTASLREVHEFARESQAQSDNLLGWNVGLMGAALFATPTFLSGLGVLFDRRDVTLLVLLPWVLGILLGITGRLFALELREANNLHIFGRLHSLGFLLAADLDARTIREKYLAAMRDEGEHGKRHAKVKRLQFWTRLFYYATYIALAAGAVVILIVAVYAARLDL